MAKNTIHLLFSVLCVTICMFAVDVTAKTYVDTKERFAIELPADWHLAPVPLDTSGMVFKKSVDLSPGLMRVQVAPWTLGRSAKAHLDEVMAPFKAEIGFHQKSNRIKKRGAWVRHQVSFSMFASGDARLVRHAQLEMIIAYGHVYILYFECLGKGWKYFSSDLRRMQKSFEPKMNADTYAGLIGEWADVSDGKALILTGDNQFEMSHLQGTYAVDGGQLILSLPKGEERFRYELRDHRLRLSNSNLNVPQVFRPVSLLKTQKDKVSQTTGGAQSITLMRLYGKWRVVDQAQTEPLTLFLSPTGSMAFGPMNGRWSYENYRLTLVSVSGVQRTYHLSLDGERIRMSGGDLDKEVILVKAK